MNEQPDEEIHRVRSWRISKHLSFCPHGVCGAPPSGKLSQPVVEVFLWRHEWLLNHWPLVINSTPAPPASLGEKRVELTVPASDRFLLATSPHLQGFSQSHYIHKRWCGVKRSVMNNKRHLHLFIFKEIPSVLGDLCQNRNKVQI